MHLEFRHPQYSTPIITSAIQEIRDHHSTFVKPCRDTDRAIS
jgi:hypothetical protein